MSALPPKADIGTQPRNVRFVPKADIPRCGKKAAIQITASAVASGVDGISAGSCFLNVRLRKFKFT